MMAWGKECSSWDTAVDIANIEEFSSSDIPEDRFVMTTWHNEEPLEEVFWFCKNCADHPTTSLPDVIILHISSEPDKETFLKAYNAA
jgi:hypothetical protein